MPNQILAAIGIPAIFLASTLLAASPEMHSIRTDADVALDTNPDSPFWKNAEPVFATRDNRGNPVTAKMEVQSRWTSENIYFLFQCPFEELYLKPSPTTTQETNELWNWDVAEVFIGSDFKNIKRYREFEVSPQGEWVDLDIDLSTPHHEDGWTWNSGFQSAARIDRGAKVWYAAMRIPWSAITPTAPKPGATFRINLYLSEGPPSNHKSIVWQPTLTKTFHTPERFGLLRIVAGRR